MLAFYDRETKGETLKDWYNGYSFGTAEVYNPWSVINSVKALAANPEAFPLPYWTNTSSNAIVKDLVEHADSKAKAEIERLEDGNLYVSLAIPNREVLHIYNNTIMNWFRDDIRTKELSSLYHSLLSGEAESFQKELSILLMNSISYMDGKESFYHGFILGILGNLRDYLVTSNREGGTGRYDIAVRSLDVSKPPLILELKVSDTFKGMQASCDAALKQIADNGYNDWLPDEGYTEVLDYGIAFFKKQCMVKVVRKTFTGQRSM